MFQRARILVAPLDWGLGHATRCIPIIQRLLDHGAVPVIGADNGPLAVLTSEFPTLEHVRIPGIEVRYSESEDQRWSMLRQFPRLVSSIGKEQTSFRSILGKMKFDAVISDQRFGLHSGDIPSVLITHQVFPFAPMAQCVLRKVNRHHMTRFDRCWIMDVPEAPGMAGELSHGRELPPNATYIGTHSRMRAGVARSGPHSDGPFRIVAVISGPEPQRSMLERLMVEQLLAIPGEHLLVRGTPRETESGRRGNIRMVPHLSGVELAAHLSAAELIVARSGYTTLMDLEALGRSALIIPTPGQSEQEYLGELHGGTGRHLVQAQHSVDIGAALLNVPRLPRATQTRDPGLLERALKGLAEMLH
jgi:hypothetical protein